MSAVALSDPAHTSSPGLSPFRCVSDVARTRTGSNCLAVTSKKKSNKKKKNAKGKSNGDTTTGQDAIDSPIDDKDGDGEGDEPEAVSVRMPPVRLRKPILRQLTLCAEYTKGCPIA